MRKPSRRAADRPYLSETLVRAALDGLRQAAPLGDHALAGFVVVQRRLHAPEAVRGPAATDHAIAQALVERIVAGLDALRALEGLPPIAAVGGRRAEVEAALREDFRRGNAELEAWSALYHRYVRVDLDLQMQAFAALVGQDLRTLRRRLAHGVARLTAQLIADEREARARQAALRMRLALPAAAPPDLVGIEAVEASAWSALAGERGAVALHGAGGIGKTALARRLALRLIDEGRIDDLAWLPALLSPVTANAIVSRLLEALGLAGAHPDPATRPSALRAHAAAYRLLVVLDSAEALMEDAPTLTALLDALSEARVLITSRVAPPAASGVHVVALGELDERAAWALMEREAGLYVGAVETGETVAARRAAQFARVWETVGGNPLALRVAAAHLRLFAADRVAGRVGALPVGLPAGEVALFDALYRAAWDALDADARRVWLALLVFPQADAADLDAALAMPPDALDAALTTVARRALVDVQPGARPAYTLLRLTRAFLESRLDADPTASAWVRACAQRVAGQLIAAEPAPAGPGAPAEPIFERGAHLVAHAARFGLEGPVVVDLAALVHERAVALGCWADWAPALHAALNLARGAGEQAALRVRLAEATRHLGDLDGAVRLLLEAVHLATEAGRRDLEAIALVELAAVYRLADLAGAEPTARRALQAAEAADDPASVSRALAELAQLNLDAGRPDQALALLGRGAAPAAGRERWQALAGDAYLEQGRLEEALEAHRRALALARERGHRVNMARALVNLGRVQLAAGDLDAAETSFENALAIMDQTHDALGQARARANLAVLYARQGRHAEAIDLLRAVLDEQERAGDWQGISLSRRNLADLHLQAAELALKRGHEQAARRHLAAVEALRASGRTASAQPRAPVQ